MPRRADTDQRREQIIDGLIRVAAREGLHAVTMRSVAREARVSLRLVQYYFETKARLMYAALRHLEEQSNERWQARLAETPEPGSARAVLESFFAEALPTDERSRTFQLLWTSYAVLAMTDPDLAAEPFVSGPNRLEVRLTEVLDRAKAGGEIASDLDTRLEAARLLSINHGLGTSVLVGQRSADEALSVMDYHLARLFDVTEG